MKLFNFLNLDKIYMDLLDFTDSRKKSKKTSKSIVNLIFRETIDNIENGDIKLDNKKRILLLRKIRKKVQSYAKDSYMKSKKEYDIIITKSLKNTVRYLNKYTDKRRDLSKKEKDALFQKNRVYGIMRENRDNTTKSIMKKLNFTLGKTTGSIKKVFAIVQKGINYMQYQDETIIRTETTRVQSKAELAIYKKEGVERIQIKTMEDNRVCEICNRYKDKIYNIDKAIPLPLHPNGRCYYIPYMEG